MFSLIFIKNGFADHPGLVEAGTLPPPVALHGFDSAYGVAWRGFSVNPAGYVKKDEDDFVGIDEAAYPNYALATDLCFRAVVQKRSDIYYLCGVGI